MRLLKVILILSPLILVLTPVTTGALAYNAWVRDVLDREGLETDAHIDAFRIYGEHRDVQRVRYSFDAEGSRYTHELDVPLRLEALTQDGSVRVVYRATDPSLNRPRSSLRSGPLDAKMWAMAGLLLSLLLLWGTVGTSIWVWGARKHKRIFWMV